MEELQYCEICGSELDEAGICHNTMCINSPDYEPQLCPDCGGILEDGICHNSVCPSSPDYVNPDDPWRDPMMDDPIVDEPMEQTCPNCGSLLGDDGLCHTISCSDSPDYIPEVESIHYYGLTLRAIEQTQIGVSDASTNNNVYYSFDGEDWDLLGDGITLEEGQEMALKCTGKCYRTITMNGGKVKAYGDLASMFYERAGRIDASGEHNAFMELFANCTALYDVSHLYLDVYTNSRTTHFLLHKMFYGCTNIEQAPVINFECNTQNGNGSFEETFYGCTSLKSAKSVKLIGYCRDFQMAEAFYGCENLEESPLIFWDIVNIGCKGFDKAFYGCSKLKKIYTDISVYYPRAAQNWVYGVAPTGTFYKLGTADIPTGTNGIPQGWAVKYTMDELIVTPTALSFKAAGATKTVDVDAEYEWGATTDADWISLQKKVKDTSYAIFDGSGKFDLLDITTTENDGDERRADVLIEDTEGNQKILAVKQKSAGGVGHPFYFGGIEIPNLYLGDIQITYAYLGGIEVYANGPYNGLKAIPAALSFSSAALSNTLKIKATDGLNWQITNVPTWLTLSQTEGVGSAEIEVTATELEEETTTTMMLAGGDYSVEIEVMFSTRGYIRLNSNAEFTLDFDAGVEYNKNNYLRIELNWDEATDSGFSANGLLYSNNGPWFALDHFHNGTYWCAGSSTLVNEVHNYEYNTNGYQTTFVSVFNNGSLTCDNGDLHRQSSFNGGIGSGKVKLFFFNNYRGDFYEMKIFNTPDGDPVYDFIASKNADGNGCVYDAVNHKQYLNETGNVIPFISI